MQRLAAFNWFAIKGGLGLILGFWALFLAQASLVEVGGLIAVYLIFDGIVTALASTQGLMRGPVVALLVQGILTALAGLIGLFLLGNPGALIFTVAAWAIVASLLQTMGGGMSLTEDYLGAQALLGGAAITFGLAVALYMTPGMSLAPICLGLFGLMEGMCYASAGYVRHWRLMRATPSPGYRTDVQPTLSERAPSGVLTRHP
jgi:uncharacterized membrane protein HdeD (DUF308 family)